jgi:hypothetical protein
MLQDIIILEKVKNALSASTLSYIHPISHEEVSPYILKVEMTEKHYSLHFVSRLMVQNYGRY